MTEERKLPDDLMNKVNGGYIWCDGGEYKVVDIRGQVVKVTENYNEAVDICNKYNLHWRNIKPKEIEEQRQWWEEEKREGATDEAFEMYFYGRVLNGGML